MIPVKQVKCKKCDVDLLQVKYLGKKELIDAKTRKGFVLITDEYGNTAGVETVEIHELHEHTCKGGEPSERVTKTAKEATSGQKTEKKDPSSPDDRIICFSDKCEKNDTKSARCNHPDDMRACEYRTGEQE